MTYVMGILNVTDNSFSDTGKFLAAEDAIQKGLSMKHAHVDIIDVGGEATSTGKERVSIAEEHARILPVIKELATYEVCISVDTMNATTAQKAIEAGAHMINDISGGLADEKMFETVASLDVPYIMMHWRGHATIMDQQNQYEHLVQEVADELNQRIEKALSAGVKREHIIIDPGLGFAKNVEQNWELLEQYDVLKGLGFPLLIGGSRKRFLARFGVDETPESRDAATLALSIWAAEQQAWAVRVHAAAQTVQALRTYYQLHKNKGKIIGK